LSLFSSAKAKLAASKLAEEQLYAQAAEEVASGQMMVAKMATWNAKDITCFCQLYCLNGAYFWYVLHGFIFSSS